MYCVAYVALYGVRAAYEQWELRRASRASGGGFQFLVEAEIAESTRAAVAKVADALNLIHRIDHRKFVQVRRDMPRILVKREAKNRYWHITGTCVLKYPDLLQRSDARIALILIHEATHARLHRAGIRSWPHIRERLERVCIKAEYRFAKRLEAAGWNVQQILEYYADKLGMGSDKNGGSA